MAEKNNNPREMGFYISLAQVGMEMAVPIVVGVVVDYYFRTSPWGVVIGAVLGFCCGLVHLIALVNRHDKGDYSSEEQDSK